MARWMRRGLLPLACLLVALGALALASGCGGAGNDRTTAATTTVVRRVVAVKHEPTDRWTYARARFNEMCAGCHTLADAGARGRRFNLDHASGVDETHARYTIAHGEPGMPAWEGVLSGREFEELVAYVSTVAKGTPGDDYWHRQIMLRMEGTRWSAGDTRALEAYAKRLNER